MRGNRGPAQRAPADRRDSYKGKDQKVHAQSASPTRVCCSAISLKPPGRTHEHLSLLHGKSAWMWGGQKAELTVGAGDSGSFLETGRK